MKLLITGATGFLGKHVVKELQKQNFTEEKVEVFTFNSNQYDITDPSSTRNLFDNVRPDVVLHMAAICGGIKANQKAPADFAMLNTKMAINMIEYSHHYNVKYFHGLGSVCMYPKHCPVPFSEDKVWEGYPEETNAPYGQAKRMLLTLQNAYREQYGLRGSFLIPVNLYGPEDNFDLESSHVIPALIRKFTEAKENNIDHVDVWGTGEATREFLYAPEAAHAITKAVLTNLDHPEPINLGTGKDISIADLAALIAKLVDYNAEIRFTGEVSDGQPKRKLNVSRAEKILGWKSKTSLLSGLSRTIDWYLDNKN